MNNDESSDIFKEKFDDFESVVKKRAELYWFWYWKSFYFGLFVKIFTAIFTALLVGDVGLRHMAFYPQQGLLDILPVLVGIFVALDSWLDPWEQRKLFLIVGQQTANLARISRLEWEEEISGENLNSRKREILQSFQEKFEALLKKASGIDCSMCIQYNKSGK